MGSFSFSIVRVNINAVLEKGKTGVAFPSPLDMDPHICSWLWESDYIYDDLPIYSLFHWRSVCTKVIHYRLCPESYK